MSLHFPYRTMPTTSRSEEECLPQSNPLCQNPDERTLLLSKTSSQVSSPAAECENGKKAIVDEQDSKRKFVGIVAGIFLGSCVAGLGEFGYQVMRLF